MTKTRGHCEARSAVAISVTGVRLSRFADNDTEVAIPRVFH